MRGRFVGDEAMEACADSCRSVRRSGVVHYGGDPSPNTLQGVVAGGMLIILADSGGIAMRSVLSGALAEPFMSCLLGLECSTGERDRYLSRPTSQRHEQMSMCG
jgi:hypothetical protein